MALVPVGCKRTRNGESVSPPFPLLQLPDDLIYHIASLAHKEDHIWLATTCKRLYSLFLSCPSLRGGRNRIYTGIRTFASSVPRLKYVMQQKDRIAVEYPDDTIAELDVYHLAWHSSISTGNVPVLMHLRSMNRYFFDKWDFDRAAEHGQIGILQYVASTERQWDEITCRKAAKHGHLTVLQWLRKNKCPWDAWTCVSAAENGHLHVLQWASEHGCPWSKTFVLSMPLTHEVRAWVQAQPN
jgi:hypothetical protein